MGRRRVAMKLIEKEKLRNATFQKRKNGIMKKAHELSTLCGVDCCLIVYGPNSINDLPEVWPQDRIQVRRILEKYKAKIAEKGPKKYNVTEFLKDKMNKVEAEACKLRQERLQKLYPTWDFTFNNLGEEQLRMFVATLDSKVEDCEERIKTLKKKRDIEEKQQQQQQQTAELSSDKSSASNRSHLIFSHNNNNSSTAMLSAHNHQTLDFPLEFEDNNLYHPLMEEKQQQQQQTAELSSDKSSASNRSHLIFSHNNNNSSTAMLSAHNHQTLDFPLEFEDNNLYHPLMLQPFHPNLMPFTMITPNDSAETAFDHYDLMMREFSCPSSSWCYSSSSNNNNNYCPNYLQNSNNNILQIHDAADQIN